MACVTRAMAPAVLGCFARVTMAVPQWHMIIALTPTWGFWHDMLDCEGLVLRVGQPPRPAAPWLLAEASCHAGPEGRMTAQADAPRHPLSIIRTPRGLDFPMAADGRVGVQRQRSSLPRGWEEPPCALLDTPGFAHDPGLGCIRMAGHGPAAPRRRERRVEGTQGVSPDAPALGMAPSTAVGGACATPGPWRRLRGVGDEVMERRALSRHGPAPGSQEGCEPQDASWALLARCGVSSRGLSTGQAKEGATWLAVGGL